MIALTQKDFITRAKLTHGNKYGYSKSVYSGCKGRITIYCKSCKCTFSQIASAHLYGSGCPTCSRLGNPGGCSYKKTTEQYIIDARKIHGDQFDYSKIEYKGVNHKIALKCKIHGLFKQSPSSHLSGVGCPSCGLDTIGSLKRCSKSDFLKVVRKLHNNKYTYSKLEMPNGLQSKITIRCKEHGYFIQSAIHHYRGSGCPLCNSPNAYSKMAIRWLESESKKRRIKIQHAGNTGEYKIPGTNFSVDGYNARTKTVFEFHGDCWHGNPNVHKPNSQPHPFSSKTAKQLYLATLQREKVIKSLGYNLVVMWENDWNF